MLKPEKGTFSFTYETALRISYLLERRNAFAGTLPRPTEVDSTKGRPTKGDSKKGQSTRGEEDQHVSNYTTSTDRAWAPSLHSGTIGAHRGAEANLQFLKL